MNRTGFIGGSDMYTIMNTTSWESLYRIKIGEEAPEDLSENFKVQLGIKTESFNRNWLLKELKYLGKDYFILTPNAKIRVQHGITFKANVDGILAKVKEKLNGIEVYDNYEAIIECKHTGQFNTMESMIQKYTPQCMHYMFTTGIKKAYLSVIFGNNYGFCEINWNREYWDNYCIPRVKAFWKCVKDKQEPNEYVYEQFDDYKKENTEIINNVEIDNMVARDATNDNRFKALSIDCLENFDSHIKYTKSSKEIKELVASNEREVYNDIIKVKRDKRGAKRISFVEKN